MDGHLEFLGAFLFFIELEEWLHFYYGQTWGVIRFICPAYFSRVEDFLLSIIDWWFSSTWRMLRSQISGVLVAI